MYDLFVAHLERLLQAGEIDPDALARGDQAARKAYEDLQEQWLNTPLPDGRVPGFSVSDEQDEELFSAWDEEEAFALSELHRILEALPRSPELPAADLAVAAARLREILDLPGYPGNVLRACAGFDEQPQPEDDEELWVSVAAGIAGPISDLADGPGDEAVFFDLDAELGHEDMVLGNLCAIQHADWLAAVAALARLGPGVLASPERLARLVAESEDIDLELGHEEDDDLGTTERLFGSVVFLWGYLGIVDDSDVLTPLGWWGLPKALERAWSPAD